MDSFDRKIIAELKQNARQSVSRIAEHVNLSRSAVSDRIKRMEESGEIIAYRAITRTEESNSVKAFFEIHHHDSYPCEAFAAKMMAIDGVKSCHGISGDLDVILYVEVANMEQLLAIRNQLEKVESINKVTTQIVMRKWTD